MRDGFKGSSTIVIPKSILDDLERNRLCSQLHITDIGYYPSADFHRRDREEGISQYILIYCIKGEGWYEIGGKKHVVEANQCFILPPFTPHSYGSSKKQPWTIYWLHFKGSMADFFAKGLLSPISITPGHRSRISDRISVFEDIYNTLSNGCSRENLEFCTSALYYFLGSIKYLDSYRGNNRDSERTIIDSAIIYMKENIERQVTLSEICKFMGYSESYFSTIFKNKTGYTPINYIIHLKIQRAATLLDTTNLKVSQICHKVGIADPYYFSKLFTSRMGKSPSAYRAETKG